MIGLGVFAVAAAGVVVMSALFVALVARNAQGAPVEAPPEPSPAVSRITVKQLIDMGVDVVDPDEPLRADEAQVEALISKVLRPIPMPRHAAVTS